MGASSTGINVGIRPKTWSAGKAMANLKITELTALGSPALEDVIAVVDDVAGTPITKKATLADVLALAGGGNATYTSTIAGPPSSPAAGDLWFPSNSFYVYRYSGSAWVPWGPLFPMTAPVSGDFSWVNQGGASVDVTNGGIYLSIPASASQSVRARTQAAPVTSYVVTAAFIANSRNVAAGGYQYCGIGFRDSVGGKMRTLQVEKNTTDVRVTVTSYASPTTNDGNEYNEYFTMSHVVFFRIADDLSTTRTYSISFDGIHFLPIYTDTRTTYLTANEVFFFANETANKGHGMTLRSWKVT